MGYFSRLLAIVLLPGIAFAAPSSLSELLEVFMDIIGLLVPLIFALIFLTISWGVVKTWIMGGGSPDEIDNGKRLVTVGVIVLAIMVSIWGIVRIVAGTLFGS